MIKDGKLAAWVGIVLIVLGMFLGAGIAWGCMYTTVEGNAARITKAEARYASIDQRLSRIEGKLGIEARP